MTPLRTCSVNWYRYGNDNTWSCHVLGTNECIGFITKVKIDYVDHFIAEMFNGRTAFFDNFCSASTYVELNVSA